MDVCKEKRISGPALQQTIFNLALLAPTGESRLLAPASACVPGSRHFAGVIREDPRDPRGSAFSDDQRRFESLQLALTDPSQNASRPLPPSFSRSSRASCSAHAVA